MGLGDLSATTVIVGITALVSVAAFSDRRLFEALLFDPFTIRSRGQSYRFITHALVHANWPHLLVNMFVLYSFGEWVEALLPMLKQGHATIRYVALYIGGVVCSSIPAYFRHAENPMYRAVGASGAVSAVLFAQILMLPTRKVALLILPVPMPAWVFGGLYLAYSWHMDKRSADNVAHDAHFYGALFGIVFMGLLHPELVLRPGSFQHLIGL
jgi:membrane associated rhomboid family serine protease